MTAGMAAPADTGLGGQLAPAFPAEFAGFGRTLDAPGEGAVPLPDLLQPSMLAGIAVRFGAGFPGGDGMAVLSYWSQYFLLALVPAAVAAAVAAQRSLPLALDGMGATLSPAGQPTALCLPHPGGPAAGCPVGLLTPLLRAHLEPLAGRLCAAGLPPRVLWGNAGAVLAWTLGVVRAPAERVAAVSDAVRAARWADGGANPLAMAYNPARGLCRQVCCLRFRLPGVAQCGDCPRGRARRS